MRSSIYTGQFEDDFKSGFGTIIWSTGGRYDGQFKRNKRHGQGKMIWGDGTTYEGQWKDGMQNGLGKLEGRKISKIGQFINNKFVKDQKFIFDNMVTGVFGEFRKSHLIRGDLNFNQYYQRSLSVMNLLKNVDLKAKQYSNL